MYAHIMSADPRTTIADCFSVSIFTVLRTCLHVASAVHDTQIRTTIACRLANELQ